MHQRLLGSSQGAHSWGGVGGVFMGRELLAGALLAGASRDWWGCQEALCWFWTFDLGYVCLQSNCVFIGSKFGFNVL